MIKRIQSISASSSYTILLTGFGKAVLYMLFLYFNSLYSQEGLGTAPTISLNGDAKIYSVDSDFNSQFMAQKNADYEISSSGEAYVFKSKADPSVKKIAKRKVRAYVPNVDQVCQRSIRKNISDFEQQKKLFDFCNINGTPFSREQPYSSDSNRNYILSSTTSHNFLKACVFQYNCLNRLRLEHYYIWNYHYFNNCSLDFCFSEIFSVRPPPLFFSLNTILIKTFIKCFPKGKYNT